MDRGTDQLQHAASVAQPVEQASICNIKNEVVASTDQCAAMDTKLLRAAAARVAQQLLVIQPSMLVLELYADN